MNIYPPHPHPCLLCPLTLPCPALWATPASGPTGLPSPLVAPGAGLCLPPTPTAAASRAATGSQEWWRGGKLPRPLTLGGMQHASTHPIPPPPPCYLPLSAGCWGQAVVAVAGGWVALPLESPFSHSFSSFPPLFPAATPSLTAVVWRGGGSSSLTSSVMLL